MVLKLCMSRRTFPCEEKLFKIVGGHVRRDTLIVSNLYNCVRIYLFMIIHEKENAIHG